MTLIIKFWIILISVIIIKEELINTSVQMIKDKLTQKFMGVGQSQLLLDSHNIFSRCPLYKRRV